REAPQGTGPRCFTSAPVNTAATPGRERAAAVFMLLIRAAACGLRTMQAWCMPGFLMSSTYTAVPVISRGSSRRRIRLPTRVSGLTVVVAMLRPRLCRRRFDGVHDVLVSGTAAQISFQAVADLRLAGIGMIREHL